MKVPVCETAPTIDPNHCCLQLSSTTRATALARFSCGVLGVCDVDEVLAPPRVRCVARRPGGGRKRPACEAVTVRHTAFSADGTHLVGGCDDGSVYIWRLGAAVEEAAE